METLEKIPSNSFDGHISEENEEKSSTFKDLLRPELKLVLMIGIVVAILQQITGINSVFFYAPMIFEQWFETIEKFMVGFAIPLSENMLALIKMNSNNVWTAEQYSATVATA